MNPPTKFHTFPFALQVLLIISVLINPNFCGAEPLSAGNMGNDVRSNDGGTILSVASSRLPACDADRYQTCFHPTSAGNHGRPCNTYQRCSRRGNQ